MTNLNALLHKKLSQTEIKIWYQTRETFRAVSGIGIKFGIENGLKVELNVSHKLVGTLYAEASSDITCQLEEIFTMMQGEVWSPNGEARPIISKAGLSHTSMSVGDIVQVGDQFYSCDMMGFFDVSCFINETLSDATKH
ncbi:hypothetical protein [Psychromonas sp. SP041]|uniref:hypothetical protein n=1 Tax=Psychromonas sp. SP041 TaxID=1365007 RepID=UPI0010C7D058|nr:hypothetical protein [Psychromonas sp. SP041]